QTVEDTITELDEDDNEVEVAVTHNMNDIEFGESRRLKNSAKPANAFCYYCKSSLWTKVVPTRYSGFQEWSAYEKKIIHAIHQENPRLLAQIQSTQPERPTAQGMPYRIAAV